MQACTQTHLDYLEAADAPKGLLDLASQGIIQMRNAPMFGQQRQEYVAKYRDVAHLMRNLDGSWYKGVMPWSLAIRVETNGVPSHGGTLFNNADGHIHNVDTCELVGCRDRLFRDLVYANYGQNFLHGQWYWGPLAAHYRQQLDEVGAIEFIQSVVGAPYGHLAIFFEAMTFMPVLKVLMYFRKYADPQDPKFWEDWKLHAPYCSMLQRMTLMKGGLDIVPGRELQYTSPQDTWQSLAYPIKVALVF